VKGWIWQLSFSPGPDVWVAAATVDDALNRLGRLKRERETVTKVERKQEINLPEVSRAR